MKILTEKEYNELVIQSQNDKRVEELTAQKNELVKEYERTIKHLKEDFEREKGNFEYEKKVATETELKKQYDEIAKLKLELGNATKEVEILTRAFENMGFDVKDMKEILNKVVDGLVSKNTVQLIK